jgi:hypothetical protein
MTKGPAFVLIQGSEKLASQCDLVIILQIMFLLWQARDPPRRIAAFIKSMLPGNAWPNAHIGKARLDPPQDYMSCIRARGPELADQVNLAVLDFLDCRSVDRVVLISLTPVNAKEMGVLATAVLGSAIFFAWSALARLRRKPILFILGSSFSTALAKGVMSMMLGRSPTEPGPDEADVDWGEEEATPPAEGEDPPERRDGPPEEDLPVEKKEAARDHG